ncbi:hypothetical protein GUITHDRAFT_115602 [Guillardia theta CCMP2712]|uniref:Uncharacterized protein n=1 Tax=Guillardia theta (strain CCMP2712) TaxID=905079 RepID=L1IQV5_GUITC|nr:hypothetical protein GUITHDRAFT_115602 [Guillardia theta CCMP2712]EKX38259.1 hypothetical protein GUITHDRAFT_115602 [Guillardia theta CCMP2712]|eukprot:XP_005825239.1 hypothetical protein GUITHDRAFT_115602 [Guillardia theta CCMP2712]
MLVPEHEVPNQTEMSMEGSEQRVKDRLRSLHNRLKVSQIMYEEMVSENLSLMKDKERIEQELKDLRKNMRNKSGLDVYPTPRSTTQVDNAAQKELNVMQQQLKVTCQEIIALRKSNTAKDNEIKQLNETIETLEREKQADDEAMQERIHQLKEEKERLEKSLVDHDSVKEELLTQKHENKYLAAELEKIKADFFDSKVVLHEYEKQETEFSNEIASLKDEMNEISESNQRMGQKIAVGKQLKMHNTVLSNVVHELFKNIERASSDLSVVQEDLEFALQMVKDLIVTKEATEKRLSQRIQTLEAQNEGLLTENERYRKQIYLHTKEFPLKLQEITSDFEKEVLEAKKVKDKQIARLLRIVSKKDGELYKLRSVWHSLLNAHPDSEWIASTCLQEVRRLKHDNEFLQNKIMTCDENVESLTVTIAIQYLKLVLANWRRPLYTRQLQLSLAKAAAIEEEEERIERMQRSEGEARLESLHDLTCRSVELLGHQEDFSPEKVNLLRSQKMRDNRTPQGLQRPVVSMIEGHENSESKVPMQNPSQQPSGRKDDDMITGESWIDDQRNRALQDGRKKYSSVQTFGLGMLEHKDEPSSVDPSLNESFLPPPKILSERDISNSESDISQDARVAIDWGSVTSKMGYTSYDSHNSLNLERTEYSFDSYHSQFDRSPPSYVSPAALIPCATLTSEQTPSSSGEVNQYLSHPSLRDVDRQTENDTSAPAQRQGMTFPSDVGTSLASSTSPSMFAAIKAQFPSPSWMGLKSAGNSPALSPTIPPAQLQLASEKAAGTSNNFRLHPKSFLYTEK